MENQALYVTFTQKNKRLEGQRAVKGREARSHVPSLLPIGSRASSRLQIPAEKHGFCPFSFPKQLLAAREAPGQDERKVGAETRGNGLFQISLTPQRAPRCLLQSNALFSCAARRAPRREGQTTVQSQSSRWSKLVYFFLWSEASASTSREEKLAQVEPQYVAPLPGPGSPGVGSWWAPAGGFELVAFSLESTHSSLEKALSSWWRSSAGFYFSCLLWYGRL